MLNVSGRWSLVTGWNWVILKDAHTEEPCRFSPKSPQVYARAHTPPTWNWRNLFRTPSARSGATAPCRKLHGQRTKVSFMHQSVMFYCLVVRDSTPSSSVFAAVFPSVEARCAVSIETVNRWLTKVWDVSIALLLKGLLIPPHARGGYCAVCEWICARGCSLQIKQAQPIWKLTVSWCRSMKHEHLCINTLWSSVLINRVGCFFKFTVFEFMAKWLKDSLRDSFSK